MILFFHPEVPKTPVVKSYNQVLSLEPKIYHFCQVINFCISKVTGVDFFRQLEVEAPLMAKVLFYFG